MKSCLLRIPPTAQWVDRSSSAYKRRRLARFFESHPRKWVDRSGQPTNEGRSNASSNSTHGNRWIVQVRPTEEGLSPASPNTTHGSGWIVQVQPKEERTEILVFRLLFPSRRKGERGQNKGAAGSLCSLNLNDPPTAAVGGIRRSRRSAFLCRLNLKNPPTAVGGSSDSLNMVTTSSSSSVNCTRLKDEYMR